ncbi:MAG: adenosine deaminase [Chloroflexi bacterium]|nr:adenosine deaminase [Chloroflexota bacterium]
MSWYPPLSTGKLNFFRSIPKVELHRHLEGSLRLSTLHEIAQAHGIDFPDGDLRSLVQMQRGDPLTFSNFLSKFAPLRQFYRSPEVIERITAEAVLDAAADGITYLELRFTPVALGRLQGYSLAEVMDWVASSAERTSARAGIQTRLIASVNRHEPVELAEEVFRLAAERMDQGVVGIDIAGNEAEFSALPFAGPAREARESGLRLTVHAGEWAGAENVRQAVEDLGAERIGHGVRVIEDPRVTALARERGTVFEVCVTSNYQSGVVGSITEHPLRRMIEAGLRCTINTDDPGISGITLSDEYHLAIEELNLSTGELGGCIRGAARAAFLPGAERTALEAQIAAGLPEGF